MLKRMKMPWRFSPEPPDPRRLPAPEGELYRRRRRVPNLLAQCNSLDRDRYAEVLQEIVLQGTAALPGLRQAAVEEDAETASLARAVALALVPDEIGAQLAAGLNQAQEGYPAELGAALLARLDDANLSIEGVLGRIDKLAQKATNLIVQDMKTELTHEILTSRTLDILFRLGEFWKNEGFTGNQENYYDPANTWLPLVLERRTGLPIALTVLYVALCQRLGIRAEGVGLPGHFICRVTVYTKDAQGYLFIDPFHQARPLDVDDCRRLVEQHGHRFNPEDHLRPVYAREVLVRMCNNLLACYDQTDKHADAERVATVLTYLNPKDPMPRMIRAERRLRRGEHRGASEDLHQILLLSPSGSLAQVALRMLRQIEYDHPF